MQEMGLNINDSEKKNTGPAFENCQNVIRREKIEGNVQMDRIFMILKIKLTPGVHLALPCSYIHVYYCRSQVSV